MRGCFVISGLNKLTLIDFPHRTSGVVYFSGCNFRCPFCHNSGIVLGKEEKIETSNVLDFFKSRKGLLEGVVLSGGEPTLHEGIFDFARKLKDMGYLIKLDTNGNRPDVLKKLVKEKLVDYVAMDFKNSLKKYGETVGIENFDVSEVKESIHFLLSGKIDCEFRTTVVGNFHEKSDFEEIATILNPESKYFVQAFVDSENCLKQGLIKPRNEDMQEYLKTVKIKLKKAELREQK